MQSVCENVTVWFLNTTDYGRYCYLYTGTGADIISNSSAALYKQLFITNLDQLLILVFVLSCHSINNFCHVVGFLTYLKTVEQFQCVIRNGTVQLYHRIVLSYLFCVYEVNEGQMYPQELQCLLSMQIQLSTDTHTHTHTCICTPTCVCIQMHTETYSLITVIFNITKPYCAQHNTKSHNCRLVLQVGPNLY